MKREFVYLQHFEKKWRQYGLSDVELGQLEDYLMENPDMGDIMRGTGGLRKLRWAMPHRGKSGSIRVLYIDFLVQDTVYMIDLFIKDEKENLSPEERNAIRLLIKEIGRELSK